MHSQNLRWHNPFTPVYYQFSNLVEAARRKVVTSTKINRQSLPFDFVAYRNLSGDEKWLFYALHTTQVGVFGQRMSCRKLLSLRRNMI